MKFFLSIVLILLINSVSYSQKSTSIIEKKASSIETTLGSDIVYRAHLSGLVKYNIFKNITIATQTNLARSYKSMGEIVSISSDNFQSINFTYTQRFGVGVVIGKERFNHTFLVMAGPKYYHLKETHNYTQIEEASTTVSTWFPDAGFLYSLKIGKQDSYFTTQLYVPFLLYPDNLMGITLSVGIGFPIIK